MQTKEGPLMILAGVALFAAASPHAMEIVLEAIALWEKIQLP